MKKLFLFEIRKLFKMKLFYICLGVVVGLALFGTLGSYLLLRMMLGDEVNEFLGLYAPTAVDVIRSELSQQTCTLMIALFVTLYLCDDNRHSTLKNIYARGYGRDGVYFTKLIVALAVTVFYVFVDWLFSFVFGCIFYEVGSAEGTLAGALTVQLLAVLAYATLFFFITTIIKKTGGSVVTNILILMFFNVILTLLDYVIFRIAHNDSFMISEYWIEGIILKMGSGDLEAKNYIISTVLCLVYAAGFIVGGMFINRKREV
ncbi:MAG: ABC transporter permease [Clostridiales bacterium]|nr:ABC transporter permease [Clostridiales bacterium]